MFEIVRYTADRAGEWNRFVEESKNGTFLFHRNYMDYHSDRFDDFSLMFYRKHVLYALLPANRQGQSLYSHQGLTYGGLVMSAKCTTAMVCELFAALNAYLREEGMKKVVYKHVPWIYSMLPSEEDLFALTSVCHAQLVGRDVASVVLLNNRLPYATLRRRGQKKALRAQVAASETDEWSAFWQLLEERLWQHHGAHPVHSLAEIQLLHSRMPQNIWLFVARHEGRIVGGTVLYVNHQTVKTQYIAANEEGLEIGALDFLFDELLRHFAEKRMMFFDFGTSNMPHSNELHDSLIHQKEGFGGRAVCYDTYEWTL